jgi:hypothetical protein
MTSSGPRLPWWPAGPSSAQRGVTTLHRTLGFNSGQATVQSHFGLVPADFGMDNVSCGGEELDIRECPHITLAEENCGSAEGAGVICF